MRNAQVLRDSGDTKSHQRRLGLLGLRVYRHEGLGLRDKGLGIIGFRIKGLGRSRFRDSGVPDSELKQQGGEHRLPSSKYL